MGEVYLEFEKPIAELKKKIAEWDELSATSNVDMSAELDMLRNRLNETVSTIFSNLTPWQRVQLARHPERPYTLDYIERIFTDFIELHGDRRFSDDKAVVGGFAKLDGKPVMVIGTQKGRDVKSNMMRNFGWPHPEGYRKALRLMHMADLSGVPVITLIDTPGAFPGIASEERHIGEAIALCMRDMFSFKVPIIAVIIGEGGSGGALAIGVGDRVNMLQYSTYSVISPEGCASILWKSADKASLAAEAMNITADRLKSLKLIDNVVQEPLGGAHRDYDTMAENLKARLLLDLRELADTPSDTLVEQRFERLMHYGYC